MQTILGSGGAIGIELAKALKQYSKEIRLVSRNPKAVNSGDQLMAADLLVADDVNRAIKGSSVVYLTAGFKYNIKVWRSTWPLVMQNVIEACKKHNTKLVFFDNIYMYHPSELDGMNEDSIINPVSKKGQVRKQISELLLSEVKAGKLTALIARSADFYGPTINKTSVLTETVFNNLASGKKAMWMSSVDYKHSFTYTPDAGKATALLGNTEDAYNQVWHLPTASDPLTGKEWIELIAKELSVTSKFQVLSKFMLKAIGLFIPVMKEMVEMMYQYDGNYVFDSSKFEKRFDYKPTTYKQGVKEIVLQDYKN